MLQALPHRRRQKTNPPRAEIKLQSLVGIDLAVFRALRLVVQRQLHIGLVDDLARHQLIPPRRLHWIDRRAAGERRTISRILGEERLAEICRAGTRNEPAKQRGRNERRYGRHWQAHSRTLAAGFRDWLRAISHET